MLHIRNLIKVDASPIQAWQVVGDLAGASRWIPGLASARMEGMTRICTMEGGVEIQEEISSYSDERRTYSYTHIQTPLPVKTSRGSFIVEADGEATLITWDAEVEPLEEAMKDELAQMIEGAYKQTIESLKLCIENSKG